MDITILLGWIGSILFAFCAVPQVVKCYKEKHAEGLSWGFLMMWFWGEVLCSIHIWHDAWTLPVFLNYLFNIACILVFFYYKLYPSSSAGQSTPLTSEGS